MQKIFNDNLNRFARNLAVLLILFASWQLLHAPYSYIKGIITWDNSWFDFYAFTWTLQELPWYVYHLGLPMAVLILLPYEFVRGTFILGRGAYRKATAA